MKAIWKFPLDTTDTQEIQMPVNINFLDIQMQYETPCLWGLVDTEAQKENRIIKIFGTGNPIPDDFYLINWTYLGTYQIMKNSSPFVFHVFVDNKNYLNSKL